MPSSPHDPSQDTPTVPDLQAPPAKPAKPSKTPSSSPPPSGATALALNRNTILVGMGAAVAITVPPTLQAVQDPTARALLSLLAIVVVFGLGYLTIPRKG